ncbi:heme ABC transporter ATP-binding protein [Amylibacter kogurei]|uniref:Heme ABC transporter ATP-binding protein n=1 Tax=Paramylibacter kogurei TaxID=1889778 RepID=A0A2G5K219_9RHOB|nr:ABC transporter ATP-binding protein [Amylibacter kogurei]PIB23551.1 heme ABC transporter ATP-binding protein [Amylibacter kogurei]
MNKTSGANAARYALELQGVSKSFGLVRANRNIDLKIESGTIHGIIGENGAGKSTLMNILFGMHRADSGKMFANGEQVNVRNSADAIAHGIGMVHQHFMLVNRFSVLENVMLGSEGGSLLKQGKQATIARLKELGDTYGMVVDPHALISDLNVGMRQRVEILKALKGGARILILDEPTGVLTPQETEQLFEILRVLRADGVTVLLITHKLAEIMEITDNVSIMRAGKMVGHRATAETSPQELAELMVGRKVLLNVDKDAPQTNNVLLDVQGLGAMSSRGHRILDDVSFQVKGGEILGIAGVSGNGQTPLMEILTGMRIPDRGHVEILGETISHDAPKTPKQLREIGVGHIPEDRHVHGLVLDFEAQENMILGYHDGALSGDGRLMDRAGIRAHCETQMEKYDVRPRDPMLPAANFSGGNQQKIVIAREMYSNPKVLIVGQPTRGVDVGAIEFIHKQLIALRDAGCAIVVVSVELDEVMGLSDRIMVMNDGKNIGIVDADKTDTNMLGLMMAGIEQEAVA